MEYNKLGSAEVDISRVCLGTMTWGEQNTEKEAHEQLDFAIAAGVNFIDVAEMYPVPPKANTQGLTESYLGSWLKLRNCRDKVVLASKVTGPARNFTYIRGGARLTRMQIRQAIESSLQRLQTDYLDLYQVHWPERGANFFGQLGYVHDESEEPVPIIETLETLNALVKEGKIRFIGLSNETPWGVMTYLRLAQEHDLARVVSVQNPYSLLNRSYEIGLAEISHREKVGLLAYSPLAFGVLSGKYLKGEPRANGRVNLYKRFDRYSNKLGRSATEKYVKLARKHGLNPAQMALSYVNSRPFLDSNIIGATTMDQLKDNIAAIDLKLDDEVTKEIEAIHERIPNPCP